MIDETKKAPERMWLSPDFIRAGWDTKPDADAERTRGPFSPFVNADLYDAVVAERDTLRLAFCAVANRDQALLDHVHDQLDPTIQAHIYVIRKDYDTLAARTVELESKIQSLECSGTSYCQTPIRCCDIPPSELYRTNICDVCRLKQWITLTPTSPAIVEVYRIGEYLLEHYQKEPTYCYDHSGEGYRIEMKSGETCNNCDIVDTWKTENQKLWVDYQAAKKAAGR